MGRLLVLAAAGWLLGVLGCSYTGPQSSISEELRINLKPEDYEWLGSVSGESRSPRILLVLNIGSPDPAEADAEAMQQAIGANWLANRYVTFEERIIVPWIYHEQVLRVEGDAIRFRPRISTPPSEMP